MSAGTQNVEHQLGWERRRAPYAAAGAVAAVVLQVAGALLASSGPRAPVGPGAVLELPAFVHAHSTQLIALAVVGSAGFVALIPAFDFLYRATKFRRPEMPGFAQVTVYAGPILFGLATVGLQVLKVTQAADYVGSGATDYFAARRVGIGGPASVLGWVAQLGVVALIFSFVIVPLNAMRAGLLTRFMGVLGIVVLVGFALILVGFPLLAVAPLLSWFWLGALAYLFLGRWPGGVPPAWSSGKAEPWPSAKELREAREAERKQAEEPEAPPDSPTRPPSRKRRGRKRR